MIHALLLALFGCLAGLLSSGCSGDSIYNTPSRYYEEGSQRNYGNDNQGTDSYAEKGGRAIITDRTGKSWDVTHALRYGLVPSGYQFGLGPYAIQPIVNPQMLSPGHPNYPSDSSDFPVLGVSLSGFIRAYPTWDSALTWHEVANEVFGETHVAVAF